VRVTIGPSLRLELGEVKSLDFPKENWSGVVWPFLLH
jgi:hypothetical protein